MSDDCTQLYLSIWAEWRLKTLNYKKQNRIHVIILFKEPTTGSYPEPDDSSPTGRSTSV